MQMTAPVETPAAATTPSRALLLLASLGFAVAVVTAAAGYFPTQTMAGSDAIPAMFAGVGIAFIATLIGILPLVCSLRADPMKRHNAAMGGMLLRMVVAAILAAIVASATDLPYRPLLLWVGIGYITQLAVEMFGLVKLIGQADRS